MTRTTEMSSIRLVLFDINNRIRGPYLAAIDRIPSAGGRGRRVPDARRGGRSGLLRQQRRRREGRAHSGNAFFHGCVAVLDVLMVWG
jgi:hypothetical protein